MEMLLSDQEKLFILLAASVLIILTLLITTCLVRPECILNRIFLKPQEEKKKTIVHLSYPPALINGESQHFHLSVQPVYGSDQEQDAKDAEGEKEKACVLPLRQLTHSLNQYENLSTLAEKARLCYTSLKTDHAHPAEVEQLAKIDVAIAYEQVSEWAIRLHASIHRLVNLKMKACMVEPSCYVTIVLVGNKTRRRSIINKVTQSELYRSETVKRSTKPVFANANFVSEELPQSLLKEGTIKFRVMDDERYANDTCIGQVTIPLKTVKPISHSGALDTCEAILENTQDDKPITENNNGDTRCNLLVLFPIKEIKGELLVGFCYLPTSKRISVTIVKGSVRHSLTQASGSSTNVVHQAFFTKVLMFNNGKLMMKRRTSLSIRLLWDKNETLAFELPADANTSTGSTTTFMVVLAYKFQNSTSPLSPEGPNLPEVSGATVAEEDKDANNNNEESHSRKNSASANRKDRCIGHFTLDPECFLEEIIKSPRTPQYKWYKLY